jgi:transposase
MATTRSALASVMASALYVAFELGKQEWKLGLTSGFGVPPWVQTIAAGDFAAMARVLAQARRRFGVAGDAPVWSCYEAGRDGFWIHRALVARGLQNRVVDSASIEVNRRQRRMKTDRIDAGKLVTQLVRAVCGEPHVWREVRVPSVEVEAARQVSRERTALMQEQIRLQNQIGSWLATAGCGVSGRTRRTPMWWTTVRDWAGTPLAATLQARIARAEARLAVVRAQLAEIETQQAAQTATAPAATPLGRLVRLKGVATTSASGLLDEGLVWREFRNRREVGGFLGFAPTHFTSGTTARDQGISRAGNARLRALSIQLAWSWVRWQPFSALTRWYRTQFGERRRSRRVGIVAVARKLLIALWRYATTGVVPEGALLKPV